MTTAMLEVLNVYEIGESEYVDFREALGRWACRWVGEVATPIAKNARELFENRAVRGLVLQWDKLNKQAHEAEMRDVAFVAEHPEDDDQITQNTWQREAGELSQALYSLLVQNWDVC